MRKSVATALLEDSNITGLIPMLNGAFNPDFFRHLQDLYHRRTGYNLVLSDVNGSIQMGLPDCDQFPCMLSCRECREQIISESLRTGKVCMDACHEGYILWGLPFVSEGKVVGGLVVIGGQPERNPDNEEFAKACGELYKIMDEHNLLPETGLSFPGGNGQVHRYVSRAAFSQLEESATLHGKAYIDSLGTAEFDTARKHYTAIQQAFNRSSKLPLDLIRGLLGSLVYQGKFRLMEAGLDSYACLSEAGVLLEKISRIKKPAQIQSSLELIHERFVSLARQDTKDSDDLLIQKATTYLEQHVRDELTRETVARAVGISPSHFSRLIREKKGRTFTDLLNQYRIEHACKLLVRTSNTLAHIANEAGFCDQSYFSKVFRRYKGMSPAKYREQHQL